MMGFMALHTAFTELFPVRHPIALAPIRSAGALLIVQVTDLGEARRAVDAGVDVIVAQGTEAGGHGGRRSILPFVPAVVDLAAPTPAKAVNQ